MRARERCAWESLRDEIEAARWDLHQLLPGSYNELRDRIDENLCGALVVIDTIDVR
jgi:hypothetical protein